VYIKLNLMHNRFIVVICFVIHLIICLIVEYFWRIGNFAFYFLFLISVFLPFYLYSIILYIRLTDPHVPITIEPTRLSEYIIGVPTISIPSVCLSILKNI
jgi:hypothetical protein